VSISKELALMIDEAYEDSVRWFSNVPDDIVTMTLGLVGEAGEFADEIKKMVRGSKTYHEALPKLREELTDIFIYVMLASRILQMDLIEEYYTKRETNEGRFGANSFNSTH